MFGPNNKIEYIIQLPDQRFLARLRHRNISILNKAYGQFLFMKSLEEIKKYIIEDLKSTYSICTIRDHNTQIAKVLKHKTVNNEFCYILTITSGVRLEETLGYNKYEYTYPVSKATLKKLLDINKKMVTFPKALSVAEETAIETIDNRIYI